MEDPRTQGKRVEEGLDRANNLDSRQEPDQGIKKRDGDLLGRSGFFREPRLEEQRMAQLGPHIPESGLTQHPDVFPMTIGMFVPPVVIE